MMMRWFVVLFCLLLCHTAWAGDLTLDVLNIGQGDALLLRHEGKTVLVDAGVRKREVAELLKKYNVTTLNLVVATHPHADHIGGMELVLEQHEVKLYIDNGLPHTTRNYERVMTAVESRGITYRGAKKGQKYRFGEDATFEVLSPSEVPLQGTRSDLNSNSVVLRLTHGDDCFLLTGDAEEPTEHTLTADGLAECEVLKVAHHGGNHSSTSSFLDAVKPSIALISAGQNNRYGHPGEETMERLGQRGIKVYRTDTMGELRVLSTGHGVKVSTEVGDGPQIVEVSATKVHAPPTDDGHAGQGSGGININTASATELVDLKGIGKGTARAIVEDREVNGPFKSVDDLTRVPGIGKKTLENLRADITIGGGGPAPKTTPKHAPIKKGGDNDGRINVNTANESELTSFPGIGPSKARAIVAEREQNGPFPTCEDLSRVRGIGAKTVASFIDRCRTQ